MKNLDINFQRKCSHRFVTYACTLLAVFFGCPNQALAQDYSVRGEVKSEQGAAIPGATIILDGTQSGTTTDAQGNFEFTFKSKPAAGAKFAISYLGYKSVLTDIVSGKSFYEIKLEEENALLDEVVVVGYGTAKKKDLTGALSTVGGEAIVSRQTTNVATALQGAMPGVTITRSSSAPDANPTIRIRGITSMTDGASDPYILIDGVPGKITDVNPSDVANITVLKDAASASIYGSQAAAGVILVTTKRAGKNSSSVTYNYTLGLDYASSMPDYMNATDYMSAVNELRYNDLSANGWNQEYARETIENYWELNRQNPDLYPNTNWLGLLLKDHAVRHSHNLSIRSGGDRRSTVLSVGYDDVKGLFQSNLEWKRYTIRINNDLQLFKWMKVSADLSLRKTDKVNPYTSPSDQMRYIPSIYAAVWSNGRYAPGKDSSNKYAALMDGGTKNSNDYKGSGKFQMDINPVKGLTVSGVFSPNFTYTKAKEFVKKVPYFAYGDESPSSNNFISEAKNTELREKRNDTFSHTTQFYANYEKSFADKHNLSAMIGYENYYYQEEGLLAENSSFPHSLIPYLSAGATSAVIAKSDDVYELARRSLFGRVMYNYANKYYIQGNLRRDGSSRFAPDHRWGTFLSASAGWVFTQEKFLQGAASWLNHGKLRASYGQLGNERIKGYYPYQTMLTPAYSVGYIGDIVSAIPGYSQISAVIPNLTWETTTTYDIGIDLMMLNNRLSVTADYYFKKTTDMLLEVPIAPILGLNDPYDNVGTMNTNGWEVSLGWKDHIGDFRYSVSFNLSDDVSKMGYIGNKRIIKDGRVIQEGAEFQSWYGFKSNGIYQTPEEVAGSAKYGDMVTVGDIRYHNLADASGGKELINNEYDRDLLASSMPHFNYGGTINLSWKGINLSMDFQGVGQRNALLSAEMVQPLRGQWYNIPTIVGEGNSWSRRNTIEQNKQARYPRYSWNSADNNYAMSDFWLFDGSYFRVKNLTLGYTLPKKWMSKISVKELTFSATLTDFFTYSHYPKGWDPEGGVTAYPITKSVVFSASLTF